MEGFLMFRGNKNSIKALKNACARKSECVLTSIMNKCFSTNHDGAALVIGGKDSHNLVVKFLETGNIRNHIRLDNLRRGKVKDVQKLTQYPTVFGIGFAPYKKVANPRIYKIWTNLLARCYCKKRTSGRDKSYAKVIICDDWLHYDRFEEWYVKNQLMEVNSFIDKDLLSHECKIYSPNTCVMLPREINNALQRTELNTKSTSLGLPVGVQRTKDGKIFSVMKHKHLGFFKNAEQAFNAYKVEKEKYLKYLAEKYKSVISATAYNALLNYSVQP